MGARRIDRTITEYLRQIGRKGGKTKTAKKTQAARASLAKVRVKRWANRRAT